MVSLGLIGGDRNLSSGIAKSHTVAIIFTFCAFRLCRRLQGRAQNSLFFQQFYLFKDFSSLGDPCRNLIRDKCRQIKGINSFLFFSLSEKRGVWFSQEDGFSTSSRSGIERTRLYMMRICSWPHHVSPCFRETFFCYFFGVSGNSLHQRGSVILIRPPDIQASSRARPYQ